MTLSYGNMGAPAASKGLRVLPMTTTTPSSNSRITRHLIVAAGLVAALFLLRTVADALVIAFGGIVLAAVLLTLSRPLARFTHLRPRWSLLLVVGGLLGLTVVFCWLFGASMADEITALQERLPGAWQKFQTWLTGLPAGRVILDSVKSSGVNEQAFTRLSSLVGAVLGATGNFLLIVFIGIYFAADPELYRDGAVRLIPPSRRPQVKRTLDHAGIALKKWVFAQAIAMAAVGILTGVALALLRIPFAASLGVVAGILEFIPVIGPIIAAVPGVLLAFAAGPQMALYAALVYVGVQQVESNVITPLVQRWAVKLPPVLGLIAIVAFGLIFGVLGVVFAMPMAVVTMVFIKELYVRDTLDKPASADLPAQLESGTVGEEASSG